MDEHRQVIVAAALNQTANDYGELVPMAQKVLENLGWLPRKGLADTGYYSKANLEAARGLAAEHGTEFFISTGRMKHSATIPLAPRGRIPAHATVGERMARKFKTKAGNKAYSRREAIVEPVFGQSHTRQGKHLLLRGRRGPAPRARPAWLRWALVRLQTGFQGDWPGYRQVSHVRSGIPVNRCVSSSHY